MSDPTRHYVTGNTFPIKEQLKALGCRWDATRKSWYAGTAEIAAKAQELVAPTPLFNSPPPQDLGTADPTELAARFGRKAVEGATVVFFTGYSKDPEPEGRIVRNSKGKRFVQVAHGRPRYYSRDMLEDFDMFGDEPGWQYQWDGVEVEPTDEERAADQIEANKKDRLKEAKAFLDAARDHIRKEGERPEPNTIEKISEGPGTETIDHGKSGLYTSPDTFVITPNWIWYELYNGRDGDDWSWNNYHGFIVHRLPFDATLADQIRAAAKLLGYQCKTEKGGPERTEIRTAHGHVYQVGRRTGQVAIDWTPPEPLYGHAELTGGEVRQHPTEGPVVTFKETVKEGRKTLKLSARVKDRPTLAELVDLAADLELELEGFYDDED